MNLFNRISNSIHFWEQEELKLRKEYAKARKELNAGHSEENVPILAKIRSEIETAGKNARQLTCAAMGVNKFPPLNSL